MNGGSAIFATLALAAFGFFLAFAGDKLAGPKVAMQIFAQ